MLPKTIIENQKSFPKKLLSLLPPLPADRTPLEIIVSHCEVNHRHGTGILTLRIFGNSPNILSIRAGNGYDGQ